MVLGFTRVRGVPCAGEAVAFGDLVPTYVAVKHWCLQNNRGRSGATEGASNVVGDVGSCYAVIGVLNDTVAMATAIRRA